MHPNGDVPANVEFLRVNGLHVEEYGHGMDDREILSRIHELVDEEDRLHQATLDQTLSDDDREKMRDIDVRIDQCWDLLRQRRAAREFGEDPEQAHARPGDTVEHYLQ